MDQFIDAEGTYSSGDNDKINFQLIVLWHLRKIMQLCCVEWHGGYMQHKHVAMGGGGTIIEYYVQNSRDCFWNAVYALYDLTYAHFDDEMIEADKTIQKELLAAIEECYVEVEGRKKIDKEAYWSLKMRLVRRLFRELCCFLKRKDYFKAGELMD